MWRPDWFDDWSTLLCWQLIEHPTRDLGNLGSNPGVVCYYFLHPVTFWCHINPETHGRGKTWDAKLWLWARRSFIQMGGDVMVKLLQSLAAWFKLWSGWSLFFPPLYTPNAQINIRLPNRSYTIVQTAYMKYVPS